MNKGINNNKKLMFAVVIIAVVIIVGFFATNYILNSIGWVNALEVDFVNDNIEQSLKKCPTAADAFKDYLQNCDDSGVLNYYTVVKDGSSKKVFRTKSAALKQVVDFEIIAKNNNGSTIWQVEKLKFKKPRNEIEFLIDLWAEALMVNDGRARYKIMSKHLQEEFMQEQKKLNIEDEFYIGANSPKVIEFEADMHGPHANILYTLKENNKIYMQTEHLCLTEENGQMVVEHAVSSVGEWLREKNFVDSADKLIEYYVGAITNKKYMKIVSYSHNETFNGHGQEMWNMISLNKVTILNKEVRDNKAYVEVNLNILDRGYSEYVVGDNILSLYIKKTNQGWYIDQIKNNEKPSSDWWD